MGGTTAVVATASLIVLATALGGWSRVLPALGPDSYAIDLRRVLEAAVIWRAGGDPYTVVGYLYSPFATVVASPWTTLPTAVPVTLWVLLEAAIAVAATLWYTRERPLLHRLLAVGVVMTFRAVAVDLALANVTTALTAAILLMCARDRIAFGLLLGLVFAAVPKPLVLPFIAWGLRYRPRSVVGVAIGAGIGTAVGLLLAGPDAYTAYVRALASFESVEFIGNEGLSFLSVPAARVVTAIAAVGFVVVLWRRGPVTSLTWASVLGIFVAPYVGGYASLPFLVAVPSLLRVAPAIPLVGLAAFAVAGMIPVVGAGVVLAVSMLIPEPRRST